MKCETCLVKTLAFAEEEPAICIWFMDNVVKARLVENDIWSFPEEDLK